MTSYKFNCTFLGLCGFVPNDDPAKATRVRVLFPEGDIAASDEGVRAHYPMLLISTKNLKPNSAYPNVILQLAGEEGLAVYFLTGREVRFDFHGDGTYAALAIDATPVKDPKNPQGAERTSFFTIASLEKGAADAKDVLADSLNDPPKAPDPNIVAARARIAVGRLFVKTLTQTEDSQGKTIDEIWDFVDNSGKVVHSQVLADEIVLEQPGLSSDVTVTAFELTTVGSEVFELHLGPSTGETSVDIAFLASELEGLFEIVTEDMKSDRAEDIKLTYRMSTHSGPAGDLPIPERRQGGAGRPVHCPRAAFLPNAGA